MFGVAAYRYDIIKAILEHSVVSPGSLVDPDTSSLSCATGRQRATTYTPGLLALSKYWGKETLFLQSPTLAPPSPPPARPVAVKKSGESSGSGVSPEDEEEMLLQQHILNVQIHILQQEALLRVEDAGYQYFVDICREDALHVS